MEPRARLISANLVDVGLWLAHILRATANAVCENFRNQIRILEVEAVLSAMYGREPSTNDAAGT